MSVAHTQSVVQFDAALRALADQARTRYPGEAARLDRGLVLALNGHVTLAENGHAFVRSGSDPEVRYVVMRTCDCPDVERAPDGRCKHRWAASLVRKARASLATATAPTAAPVHAYHMLSGDHGYARILSDGRVCFHPGGHKYSFICAKDELCLGPALAPEGRPY
jgi:hypothetical protein